jgi:hypothetical protein
MTTAPGRVVFLAQGAAAGEGFSQLAEDFLAAWASGSACAGYVHGKELP